MLADLDRQDAAQFELFDRIDRRSRFSHARKPHLFLTRAIVAARRAARSLYKALARGKRELREVPPPFGEVARMTFQTPAATPSRKNTMGKPGLVWASSRSRSRCRADDDRRHEFAARLHAERPGGSGRASPGRERALRRCGFGWRACRSRRELGAAGLEGVSSSGVMARGRGKRRACQLAGVHTRSSLSRAAAARRQLTPVLGASSGAEQLMEFATQCGRNRRTSGICRLRRRSSTVGVLALRWLRWAATSATRCASATAATAFFAADAAGQVVTLDRVRSDVGIYAH